jgi:hypothetical protein
MDPRLVVAGLGLVAAFWSVSHWRQAIQVVMVLLVVEGAIRKWLFPGAQDLVYLAKDVLLLAAYLGAIRERALTRQRPPGISFLYSTLVFGAVFGALEIFNPRLPNVMVGAFGFKAYFLYVPLLLILPAVFPTDQSLVSFLRRYIYLSLPVGVLAVAQFFSPASSSINTYARAAEDVSGGYISTFGSSAFVRVTASFSYITGYGSYLIAITILVLAYLAAVRWRLSGSVAVFAALGTALLGMLMTGSRGPVFILSLLFPLYWWLAVMRGGQGGATFGRLLLGLSALGILIGSLGSDAVSAFLGRASSSGDVSERLSLPFLSPWEILPEAGLFGYGIGATHQTATAFTQGIFPYSWLHGLEVEAETGRIMVELGPIGFLLIYFVRIYMIVFALRSLLALRTAFHRAIATACLLFFLAQLLGSVVFDVTTDLFYWFFGGLLVTAIQLDRQAALRAARAAAPSAAARPGTEPPPARPIAAPTPPAAPAGAGAPSLG